MEDFPGRHHRGQRPRCYRHTARPRTVHARRLRPVRGYSPDPCATGSASRAPWISTTRQISPRSCGARRASSTFMPTRWDHRGRRAQPGTPRGQPTAAPGPVTMPRCTATDRSTKPRPTPLSTCMKSTRWVWTASTVRCSMRWCASSTAVRSAWNTLAVSVGEESETVETVAEPFLLRLGFITRGPRGREATSRLAPPGRHPTGARHGAVDAFRRPRQRRSTDG